MAWPPTPWRLGVPAATAGAVLFDFGNPRANSLGHQQLLPGFLGLIAVDALYGVFPGREAPTWGRAPLRPAAAAGVVGQRSSGVYPGWFPIVSLKARAAAMTLDRW